MYNAHVLPIMIASPGDVQTERDIIRQIIHSWNFTDSYSRSLVVLPVGWETHASPELGVSAQDNINERLVDRCDVLVGVFWTKLGTPTGKEISGTVEEIKRHVAADKPALIYFSEKPVQPGTFDKDAWDKKEEFKAWCQPNGLYESFASDQELREKFERHFRQCLNDNKYVAAITKKFSQPVADIPEGLKQVSVSEEAVKILTSAATGSGQIHIRNYIGGWSIGTSKESFGENVSPREEAKWRSAIEELDGIGVIEERSFGSGLYFVTDSGYEAVERLSEKPEM